MMGGLYTCIRRGIIVLLLGKGSREPQDSGKRWFSRFFYLLTAYRRGHGRKKYLEMKTLFLLLFLVLGFSSIAQVNRYSSPAEATNDNTYASPNYDALLQLGAMAKQRKMEIRGLIQKAIKVYNSYPHYPQKMREGWHQTVCLCPEDDILMETKTYVNFNNEVTKIDLETQIISDIKEKIVNGKSQVGDVIVYFLEDIWQYNKNYEIGQRTKVETQKQNTYMNNRYGVGDFVKIKSDYFSMLELMVLRSQPNPNSTIVYKLQKSDLTEGIQILEEGEFFMKVQLRNHKGYITRGFLEIK